MTTQTATRPSWADGVPPAGSDPLLGQPAPPSFPAAAPTAPADAALQERLARLAAKRQGGDNSGNNSTVAPTQRTAQGPKRRRHPAKHSRTAALALSFVTTGGLGYLLAATDPGPATASAAPVGIVTPATGATGASATAAETTAAAAPPASPVVEQPAATTADSVAATAPTTAATTAPAVAAQPVVVNGETFTNRWGPVQVQATFGADGTLTAVDAVQVPYADGKSVGINNYAVPRLNSEALTAQTAQVNTVSGATYTSTGYRQSLQSAIDIAVANGITTLSAAAA
jgi:uncharacterized protein with FMN-binding domain